MVQFNKKIQAKIFYISRPIDLEDQCQGHQVSSDKDEDYTDNDETKNNMSPQ